METGEIIYEKVHASPRLLKELDSEVAESSKDTQRIQPRSKTQLSSTGRFVSDQPSVLPTQEIKKVTCLASKSTNFRTERPVRSSVTVSVGSVDKDKDTDENVDADQISMERLVSGQSIDLFTQLEERDIDFRESGLPHAVVKQAETFRVREDRKSS